MTSYFKEIISPVVLLERLPMKSKQTSYIKEEVIISESENELKHRNNRRKFKAMKKKKTRFKKPDEKTAVCAISKKSEYIDIANDVMFRKLKIKLMKLKDIDTKVNAITNSGIYKLRKNKFLRNKSEYKNILRSPIVVLERLPLKSIPNLIIDEKAVIHKFDCIDTETSSPSITFEENLADEIRVNNISEVEKSEDITNTDSIDEQIVVNIKSNNDKEVSNDGLTTEEDSSNEITDIPIHNNIIEVCTTDAKIPTNSMATKEEIDKQITINIDSDDDNEVSNDVLTTEENSRNEITDISNNNRIIEVCLTDEKSIYDTNEIEEIAEQFVINTTDSDGTEILNDDVTSETPHSDNDIESDNTNENNLLYVSNVEETDNLNGNLITEEYPGNEVIAEERNENDLQYANEAFDQTHINLSSVQQEIIIGAVNEENVCNNTEKVKNKSISLEQACEQMAMSELCMFETSSDKNLLYISGDFDDEIDEGTDDIQTADKNENFQESGMIAKEPTLNNRKNKMHYYREKCIKCNKVQKRINNKTSKNDAVNLQQIYLQNSDFAFPQIQNATNNSAKRRIRSFSLQEKITVLDAVKIGRSRAEVRKAYGLGESTLRRWLQDEQKIRGALNIENARRKRFRTENHPHVGKALFALYNQCKQQNIQLSDLMLREKAFELNKLLGGKNNFTASSYWIGNWKKKYGLPDLTFCEDSNQIEDSAVSQLAQTLTNAVEEESLLRCQIFKCDKSILNYKSLPYRFPDDRVTIMTCSNADGSLKLPLVVLGKSAKSTTLMNLQNSLPIFYSHQTSLWVDSDVLNEWFDNEFTPRVTEFLKLRNLPLKAILIADNVPSDAFQNRPTSQLRIHLILHNLSLVIGPSSNESLQSVKLNYAYKLLRSIICAQDDGERMSDHLQKINLRDFIYWISNAWDEVKPSTIVKCWRKFLEDNEECEGDSDDVQEVNELVILETLRRISEFRDISGDDVAEWIAENHETNSRMSIDNHIIEILVRDSNEDLVDDAENIYEENRTLSATEAINGLNDAIRFFEQNGCTTVAEMMTLVKLKEKALSIKINTK